MIKENTEREYKLLMNVQESMNMLCITLFTYFPIGFKDLQTNNSPSEPLKFSIHSLSLDWF